MFAFLSFFFFLPAPWRYVYVFIHLFYSRRLWYKVYGGTEQKCSFHANYLPVASSVEMFSLPLSLLLGDSLAQLS